MQSSDRSPELLGAVIGLEHGNTRGRYLTPSLPKKPNIVQIMSSVEDEDSSVYIATTYNEVNVISYRI